MFSLRLFVLLMTAPLSDVRWNLKAIFIGIYLIAKEAEHFPNTYMPFVFLYLITVYRINLPIYCCDYWEALFGAQLWSSSSIHTYIKSPIRCIIRIFLFCRFFSVLFWQEKSKRKTLPWWSFLICFHPDSNPCIISWVTGILVKESMSSLIAWIVSLCFLPTV